MEATNIRYAISARRERAAAAAAAAITPSSLCFFSPLYLPIKLISSTAGRSVTSHTNKGEEEKKKENPKRHSSAH